MRCRLRQLCLLPALLLLFGCAAPTQYHIYSTYTVADPQFAQTVGNLLGPALVPGNRVTTLINGDKIFPAMLEAIKNARQSITLETYIYWSGDIAHQFTRALCERAQAGVKTFVLIDGFGSAPIDADDLKSLQECGVQVHKYNDFALYNPLTYFKLDHRTHRKVLVVDGTIGFTGGVGIADIWAGNAQDPQHWRDTHYRLEGPAVAQLQATFADNWMRTTGDVLDGPDFFPTLEPIGTQLAQVFKSTPEFDAVTVELLMILSFAHAGKNIRIESPYFVLDDQTRKALIAGASRGVKIEIIVPGRHMDEKVVRSASRAGWGPLLKAGINIYEYQPTMIHSKLLIVDDLWVSIGSSNMDNRSFHINDEANLNVFDRDFADLQVNIFEADKDHARQVTLQEWENRPLSEQFSDQFTTFFKSEF